MDLIAASGGKKNTFTDDRITKRQNTPTMPSSAHCIIGHFPRPPFWFELIKFIIFIQPRGKIQKEK